MEDYDNVNVKYKSIKKEVSERFGWFDLPKDGGGDIDLADYSLENGK